jgi:hypothetical protein
MAGRATELPVAEGDLVLTSFFEDVSPTARKWSDAFFARQHTMPSQCGLDLSELPGIQQFWLLRAGISAVKRYKTRKRCAAPTWLFRG